MPEENIPASSTSPTASRPKAGRYSNSAGTVRGRTSPVPGDPNGDSRPQKRARKAINCEPCRNSKLKCDRNRPCSSCVLRGTSAMCYQDSRGQDGTDPIVRGDDHHYARIDPAQEIARLRHSINQLEAYVFPNRPHQPQRRPSEAAPMLPKKEPVDADVNDSGPSAPGMLQPQGGLYSGATSAATHLLSTNDATKTDTDSRPGSQERGNLDFAELNQDYDRDLLTMLPSLEIIDGLIAYYFEYCNWIYRHVNQVAFLQHWDRFKNGTSADKIVLSTACAIMAVSTFYLPAQHSLLDGFAETHEAMGQKFYEVSTMAYQRRQNETKAYSLDLMELLVIRSHYLTLIKKDSEEIWSAAGELVRVGTAMGLHRDPGKWKMHRDVSERRRWAWWHIVLFERWQSFMLGRPTAIAMHHWDTLLPSYCDPAIDKTGRLYLPNLALFRLAYILGDILDDAVSVRPVPYENVLANDRALVQWMDNLPEELDLDEYRIARNLASPNASMRRLGVQSVIIRMSYYHIRFTLHRPYASAPSNSIKSSSSDPPKSAQSLEIAVSAADKLITMVGQSRPDFLANTSLAVPGHMNWGPFHCFSAAMFFSFQLIANPDQPGAGLFRASIRKAITTLEQSQGTAVADKAYDILTALAPLYSVDFPAQPPEVRDAQRAQVLGVVRKLAFPYHDSHDPRRFNNDSPVVRGSQSSPANSSSLSPPMTLTGTLPSPYESMHAMSSVRTPTQMYPQSSSSVSMTHSPQQVSPNAVTSSSANYPQSYSMHTQMYSDGPRYTQYIPDDSTMWGAAVGFEHGEWTQFLDGLRPDVGSSRQGH
ncbi:hypothetical protein C8J56DRAFT_540993 [Mycena floridula]|nr:hypothetical protein C8J56DRAFT_540993 [Mycena floridula]